MRKRKSFYYVNDEQKQDFYKIPLEPVHVDKNIFDALVNKFGERKAMQFVQSCAKEYSAYHNFFDLISPRNRCTKEEAVKVIDRFVDGGSNYLYFENDEEESPSGYLEKIRL